MLSQTGNYALRATIYLAQHSDGCLISGNAIAAGAVIPAQYLSKILSNLVRAGLLESVRGLGGGFRLSRTPNEISLFDILEPFESFLVDQRPCPFGHRMCSDDDPCHGHDRWRKLRESFRRYLRHTTVRDVAFRQHKRYDRVGGKTVRRSGRNPPERIGPNRLSR